MTIDLFDGERSSSAVISPCGCYRYRLDRRWSGGPRACWIMLNPSTADASVDDPTLRRCVAFSRRLDYGSLVVVNLFAWRSAFPSELTIPDRDVIGPDADEHIRAALGESAAAICGWGGSLPREHGRARVGAVLRLVAEAGLRPLALGVTRAGEPRHPLYMPASVVPRPLSEFA